MIGSCTRSSHVLLLGGIALALSACSHSYYTFPLKPATEGNYQPRGAQVISGRDLVAASDGDDLYMSAIVRVDYPADFHFQDACANTRLDLVSHDYLVTHSTQLSLLRAQGGAAYPFIPDEVLKYSDTDKRLCDELTTGTRYVSPAIKLDRGTRYAVQYDYQSLNNNTVNTEAIGGTIKNFVSFFTYAANPIVVGAQKLTDDQRAKDLKAQIDKAMSSEISGGRSAFDFTLDELKNDSTKSLSADSFIAVTDGSKPSDIARINVSIEFSQSIFPNIVPKQQGQSGPPVWPAGTSADTVLNQQVGQVDVSGTTPTIKSVTLASLISDDTKKQFSDAQTLHDKLDQRTKIESACTSAKTAIEGLGLTRRDRQILLWAVLQKYATANFFNFYDETTFIQNCFSKDDAQAVNVMIPSAKILTGYGELAFITPGRPSCWNGDDESHCFDALVSIWRGAADYNNEHNSSQLLMADKVQISNFLPDLIAQDQLSKVSDQDRREIAEVIKNGQGTLSKSAAAALSALMQPVHDGCYRFPKRSADTLILRKSAGSTKYDQVILGKVDYDEDGLITGIDFEQDFPHSYMDYIGQNICPTQACKQNSTVYGGSFYDTAVAALGDYQAPANTATCTAPAQSAGAGSP